MTETPEVLGLSEDVVVFGKDGRSKQVRARIDTGAQSSSIDIHLAEELQLGPITTTKTVRSSHGKSLRPVVSVTITVGSKTMTVDFNIYNRQGLKHQVLVGRNILRKGYLIDPNKKTKV